MKVGIFGLGYVGLTTAACLLRSGVSVTGYELNQDKREQLANGDCPLTEPGVGEEIRLAVSQTTFSCQIDCFSGEIPDLFFVSVGTPSASDGNTDLSSVASVLDSLEKLVTKLNGNAGFEVVIRSTMPPGSLSHFKSTFPDLFAAVPVVFYPEFLREGTAVKDFFSPPQTVVGCLNSDLKPLKLLGLMERLGFSCEIVEAITAESLKFACNSFHALKVAFGNEMGRIVNEMGGDGKKVMEYFIRDTVLNISPKYLLPGPPYGGSCLPKDTRSIAALARSKGLDCPLLENCEASNASHLNYIHHQIKKRNPRTIAILGLAFKKDTDDVRESPSLALIEKCLKWIPNTIRVHDFIVDSRQAIGVNRNHLESVMQHSKVVECSSIDQCVGGADVIVIMQNDSKYSRYNFSDKSHVLHVSDWKII